MFVLLFMFFICEDFMCVSGCVTMGNTPLASL